MRIDVAKQPETDDSPVRRLREQAALYRFTDRLYRARSAYDVYDAALDAILSALRCERASILRFDENGIMQFVAWRGLSEAYRKAVDGHTPWKPDEADPRPITVEDIGRSGESAELKAIIKREGIAALAFIPIVANGGVAGKFMTYYAEPHVFTDAELDLCITIARQLGFAVERMIGRERRRRAEEGWRETGERLRITATATGVTLFEQDSQLRYLWVQNPMAGYTVEGLVGRTDREVGQTVEDLDAIVRAKEHVLATGRGTQIEIVNRGPDGSRIYSEVTLEPKRDEAGNVVGILGARVDVTARKSAEEELRRRADEFHALADNIPSLCWMTDATGWIYWYNKRWFDYTGTTLSEMEGWGWRTVHHPDHVERVTEKFRHCIEAGEPWEDTFPLRSRDGEYRWFLSRALPICDDSGRIVRWFGTNTDITERRRAEEQRTLLINELNHRVKNTLATVQAIAARTFAGPNTDAVARESFEARLIALSGAHSILTHENWEGAEIDQIIHGALQPYAEPQRTQLEGPRIRLIPKAAVAMAMGMHELATNAAKYGALSNESGTVAAHWSIERAGPGAFAMFHLEWHESGGPPVETPKRRGFGSRLIERNLAHDLDGTAQIDYQPEGVVCRISARLETVGRASDD